MTADTDKKQKNNLIQLYSVFAAGLFLQFVPYAMMGMLSMLLLLATMIAAYVYRAKAQEHDLQHNHSTYIIRTFWIGSLYLTVGIIAAAVLLYPQIDKSPIDEAVQAMMNGQIVDQDAILWDLFKANQNILLFIGLPLVAPGILFFIYRCVYGTSRAIKGYRLAKPNSWL